MSATQYLPLPPELFAYACDTVSKCVSQLPFLRGGVSVTGELVGVTMECLNAEPTRALPLTTPRDHARGSVADGLDRCLEQRRGVPGKTVVPVIAEVMCSAGITEMTEILDRQLHRPRKAVRLLSLYIVVMIVYSLPAYLGIVGSKIRRKYGVTKEIWGQAESAGKSR